jgi:hypothetical protein
VEACRGTPGWLTLRPRDPRFVGSVPVDRLTQKPSADRLRKPRDVSCCGVYRDDERGAAGSPSSLRIAAISTASASGATLEAPGLVS